VANLKSPEIAVLTREQWLIAAAHALSVHFFPIAAGTRKEAGKKMHELPRKLQCSCGFPYKSREAIGQCWSPKLSADGTTQVFVSPCQDEPVRVLDILLHELIHAAVGTEEGHRGEFKRVATALGLSGKMTATIAEPGSELHARLSRIARDLGPYPHKAVNKDAGGEGKKKKKKGGGWVRLMSESEPEYRVVISPRQLDEHGVPTDPWGDPMVPAED
jgi:hypothetical protein